MNIYIGTKFNRILFLNKFQLKIIQNLINFKSYNFISIKNSLETPNYFP